MSGSCLVRTLNLVRWSQMGSLLHTIFGPLSCDRFVSSQSPTTLTARELHHCPPGVSDAIRLSPSRQLCQAHCKGAQQGGATRTRAWVGTKDGRGGGLLIPLSKWSDEAWLAQRNKNRVGWMVFRLVLWCLVLGVLCMSFELQLASSDYLL